jgi:asparagine synthase (glutamine-hydrolysing)
MQYDGRPVDTGLLEAMTASLAHRGPDGEGYVLLASGREKPLAVRGRLRDTVPGPSGPYTIGLGHRRLAIIDLTPLGAQPMGTEDGLLWITYNGEVYNAPELRQELVAQGYHFRSSSDTEVVLTAYRAWGRDCLDRFNGMFAFAVWDGRERVLFCARDRFGIKPFYYREDGPRFLFGSEIKALLCDRRFRPVPHDGVVFDYLTQARQDHTTETFFRDIRQLAPGEYLILHGGQGSSRFERDRWWHVPESTHAVSRSEAVTRTRELIQDSIRLELRADVPVGSCLSGGLDSSTIVCLMKTLVTASTVPQTFSCCHDDSRYDERRYIQSVVARTGVGSQAVFPDPARLWDALPEIVWHHEEPVSGTSVLAQWEVMRAARHAGVKVLLDGQGGDEVLLGYPRFVGFRLADLLRTGRWTEGLREWSAWRRVHGGLHPTAIAAMARGLLPSRSVQWLRSRMTQESTWLRSEFVKAAHGWMRPEPTAAGSVLARQVVRILAEDLPALLHFEDRNSMAFSLEARVPFLDHRLVSWLVGLPPEFKLHRGVTKVVLRDAMAGVLPEDIRQRTDKMGFVTPEDEWLRTVWRNHIDGLLNSESLRARPYWQASALRDWYRRYCRGDAAIGPTVWRWINLECWLRKFCD